MYQHVLQVNLNQLGLIILLRERLIKDSVLSFPAVETTGIPPFACLNLGASLIINPSWFCIVKSVIGLAEKAWCKMGI